MDYLICKLCPKLKNCTLLTEECMRHEVVKIAIFEDIKDELPGLHRCYTEVEKEANNE